ncbi:MAG TPA: DUF2723 domain-containing protein [Gemmatimonadaceae bacterium]|nr:DUF2723 domain-containing protein [Gemmatimonadaceae bacterium]
MTGESHHRGSRISASLVAAVAAVVFWRTAYPTITWWDSSSYSLAAATLGIPSQPGSLLLIFLGWPVAKLAPGSPAHALNLFAGALAALTVGLVCALALRLLRLAEGGPARQAGDWPSAVGAALGALTLAFSGTLWVYAVRFTPYVLTAVFTCLTLWVMLLWWKLAEHDDAGRWVFVLTLLFGLDFSVHRTNALLIPGAVVWIAIRRPRTLRSPRAIAAALSGLVVGLAVQLLLMPVAAFTRSTLNFFEPSSWARFWDYVTLKQLGGSFLLGVFPRKSAWWSIQTMDALHVLRDNFLNLNGRLSVLGLLPATAAVLGLGAIWRANRRLAVAMALLIVLQVASTVLYFNIPPNFFRTFDRHYLPICVTIAVVMTCGFGAAVRWSAGLLSDAPAVPRRSIGVAALLIAIAVPARQLAVNWKSHDEARQFFAGDYAVNALSALPPNAIYFTVGDNDTFPVLYMQSVEGVRRDVTIINESVANIPRWPEQLRRRDPSFPMSLAVDERMRLAGRTWADTTIVVPVRGNAAELGLPPDSRVPQSITLAPTPVYGRQMTPSDVLLLDIIRTNAWKRPLTFAGTGTRNAMGPLKRYGRVEGLYYRAVPVPDLAPDAHLLRLRLLASADFRGYDDPTIPLDEVTRNIGMMSFGMLTDLLEADMKSGDAAQCRADRAAALTRLPLDRLQPYRELRDAIESACGETPP